MAVPLRNNTSGSASATTTAEREEVVEMAGRPRSTAAGFFRINTGITPALHLQGAGPMPPDSVRREEHADIAMGKIRQCQ